MAEFEGKVAGITGGGGGIGKAAAARLLDEGASVVLAGRRRDVLEAAESELDPSGERVGLVSGAVSSAGDAERLIGETVARFGRVDVLVNSTGIFRPVPFLEQTEEHMEEALDSILRPTFYTSQAAARVMAEQGDGGAIVNVGSMWAIDAITATPTSAYSAAQAGRHSLTKNLAIELAPHDIRVNTVALAFVETPAYERFMTAVEERPRTWSRRSCSTRATEPGGSPARRCRSTEACWLAATHRRGRWPSLQRRSRDHRAESGAAPVAALEPASRDSATAPASSPKSRRAMSP